MRGRNERAGARRLACRPSGAVLAFGDKPCRFNMSGSCQMRALAVFLLFPSIACAQTCGAWSAAVSEEEEGPVMLAAVCVGAGTTESNLFLKCGPEGQLNLRFLPAAALDFPPGDGGDFSSLLRLSVDGEAFDRPAHYEAMDGAMVSEVPLAGPLVDRLKAGKALTVAYPETAFKPLALPLTGSKAAIDKLAAACTGS